MYKMEYFCFFIFENSQTYWDSGAEKEYLQSYVWSSTEKSQLFPFFTH